MLQPGTQFDMFPDLPPTGHKQSRRKPADLQRNEVNHEIARDRYYYHRRLDRALFNLDGDKRIITCNFLCRSIEDIPAGGRRYRGEPTGQRHYIEQLVKLGYNVHYNLVYIEPKQL